MPKNRRARPDGSLLALQPFVLASTTQADPSTRPRDGGPFEERTWPEASAAPVAAASKPGGRGRRGLPPSATEAATLEAQLPEGGTVLAGCYRVLRELGRGSMGVVFEALDERLERRVAIKFLSPRLRDPGLQARFVDEARAMALVQHPHVASIFAFGDHSGLPYFVMQLLHGGTLAEWLQTTPQRSVRQSLSILSDVCDGLTAIHAAGAIHRDIKPSNVLLDGEQRARVADFGLAERRDAPHLSHEVAGTVAYMAPEIAFCEGESGALASPQSDVYALACLAYEVLTGQVPFDAESEVGIMYQHAKDPVLPASLVRPILTPAFDLVLTRALAKKPKDRTPSAAQFKRELLQARKRYLDPARIIVADDDADFRELVSVALVEAFPDACVDAVPNGEAALAAFDDGPTCVVVLDLDMPNQDGRAVTRALRARETADQVPIIVLSGAGGPHEWQELAAIGADRFLLKPVHLKDLIATVRLAHQERSHKHRP